MLRSGRARIGLLGALALPLGCSHPSMPWQPDCAIELAPEPELAAPTQEAAWRWSDALGHLGVAVVLSDDGAPIRWAASAEVQALTALAPVDPYTDESEASYGVAVTDRWPGRLELKSVLLDQDTLAHLRGQDGLLVSVLLHEVGHGLGLEHTAPWGQSRSAMAHGYRKPSQAYPSAGDVDRVATSVYWSVCAEALDAGESQP